MFGLVETETTGSHFFLWAAHYHSTDRQLGLMTMTPGAKVWLLINFMDPEQRWWRADLKPRIISIELSVTDIDVNDYYI